MKNARSAQKRSLSLLVRGTLGVASLSLLALGAGCSGDETAPASDAGGSGDGAALTDAGMSDGGGMDEDASGGTLPEGCTTVLAPSDDDQTTVQEAFILAAEGDTICFTEGRFFFQSELTLAMDGVTLLGSGRDATILDFSQQDAGGNGVKITGDDVTMASLEVFDTPGDGVRADDVNNITFRDMDVIWPGEMDQTSGAYGLYPVGCDGVLIEQTLVVGARDAGIYVGQSNNIIVRENEAYGNVAGIEIENSNDAEVVNNYAHDNTAGILVFNLPGLAQYGSRTKVHNNRVINNNLENFGVEGTVVASVPGGSGIIVLAADGNEIHDNEIRGNVSFAILFFTYLEGLFGSYDDEDFDPYCEGNYIHDNIFEANGEEPFGTVHAVAGRFIPTPTPAVVFDGCLNPEVDPEDPALWNCVADDGVASYVTLDFCNNFVGVSEDMADVDCTQDPLPTITLGDQ